jgi:hypothetical protein
MMRLVPCLTKPKVGTSIITGVKCFSTLVHEGCSYVPSQLENPLGFLNILDMSHFSIIFLYLFSY